MYISFFHMFSGMLGKNRSPKEICVSFHTRDIKIKINNVCQEAKVIVKIEAVFLFPK